MTNKQCQLLVGLALCVASLVGLDQNIQYSGWLMFAGIVLVL